MNTYIEAGDGFPSPTSPWVMILGGVSRPGNRRARRLVTKTLKKGHSVVWFDGFEERYEDTGARVPLDEAEFEADLFIVGYQAAEAATTAGRLHSGAGLRKNPILRSIWRLILRRVGTVLRPRAGWESIQTDIQRLTRGTAPELILYCDEYAITAAWHAGRLWESTPIATDLPQAKQ